MKAKPTMSQDGELRFNVQVTVRVGLLDLRNAVAWAIAESDGQAIRQSGDKNLTVRAALERFSSRAAVFAAVREAVAETGDGYEYWGDQFGIETNATIAARTLEHVNNLFPELKKA